MLELRDGVITVVEIAPGVDLECDVLARRRDSVAVADDLKLMDARIFTDAPMVSNSVRRVVRFRFPGDPLMTDPSPVQPDGEITLTVDGHVAVIHISRPNKLNSFTIPMSSSWNRTWPSSTTPKTCAP